MKKEVKNFYCILGVHRAIYIFYCKLKIKGLREYQGLQKLHKSI